MDNKKKNIFDSYKNLRLKLEKIVTGKMIVKASFGSFLITFLIFLIPALLIYNLFIFDFLRFFLKVLIFMLIIAAAFFYELVYFEILKNYAPEIRKNKFSSIIIVDGSAISVLISIAAAIIMIFL